MSVGTKAAGFAALSRYLLSALPTQADIWVPAVAVLAALTMVFGNVTAVAQSNVKRMLAYSSVGHAGYILMGVLGASVVSTTGQQLGVQSMLFYLVAYSLSNLAAFGVLIALEKRGEAAWSLDDLAGLASRHPWLAWAMTLAMLSLAGVPPTAGFAGKLYVFSAAWQAGLGWLVLVGVITSAIAAFFYLRVIVQMFMREPMREAPSYIKGGLRIGLAVAAVGILVVGILPAPVIDLVQNSVLAMGQ
jgi:NADH-quinone oxidoreductase subunit N